MDKFIGVKASADFFMGANTFNGFFSLYDELKVPTINSRSYLLKGGAGTGKSSLIKKIKAELSYLDSITERIHCSSDPTSYDGLILHRANINILDATPPHIIEPTYPGSYQSVVNLTEYLNEDLLEQRLNDIIHYQNECSDCHRKCRRLLKAAESLLSFNIDTVRRDIDFNKVNSVSLNLCRQFIKKPANKVGTEYKRMLSAVTNQGVVSFDKTVSALCETVVLIRDDYGVICNEILSRIKDYALLKGYSVYNCVSPFYPQSKTVHILIPELSLGFITQSKLYEFDFTNPQKVINYTRFLCGNSSKKYKAQLSFNKKLFAEIIDSAVCEMKSAKQFHDLLEKQFAGAVDFDRIDSMTAKLIKKISKRYE